MYPSRIFSCEFSSIQSTLEPAEWPVNKHLEWCPPGHGDLYTALYGSGMLDKLLADGVKYMFVSNSDNLGATLDVGKYCAVRAVMYCAVICCTALLETVLFC
jgi:UDP-N-acetylglucosamine pyrophosphorylase